MTGDQQGGKRGSVELYRAGKATPAMDTVVFVERLRELYPEALFIPGKAGYRTRGDGL